MHFTSTQIGDRELFIRNISALMTAVYFVASLFVVGNFVLCFHNDGSVYLELSKVQQPTSQNEEHADNSLTDCDESDCSDSAINDFTLSSAGPNSLDADNSKSLPAVWDFAQGLTAEASSHNGWRPDPPSVIRSHYISVLKPTLILQV